MLPVNNLLFSVILIKIFPVSKVLQVAIFDSTFLRKNMVLMISDDYSLSSHLSEAGSKLVVIDFYADWCGPCRYIAPIFEQFSQQYTEAVFVKVNVDLCRQTSAVYGVSAMPTFVFVRNNQEVDRMMGADVSELERKIMQHLSRNTTSLDSQKVATHQERQFLEKFVQFSHRMEVYEDEVAQTLALSVMPSEKLKEKSCNLGEVNQLELLKNLLRWFKVDFFNWVDTPKCEMCGTVTSSSSRIKGMPTDEEKEFGADRVEVYNCQHCSKEVRFPRYNDPVKLLETRRGRCGEWANCFALCCRALQFETRWVHDESDHVWCEVWMNDMDRWIHCDPCENVLDTPLLYEKGWGKKLNYVIAFGLDHIRDVTWRYTFDHLKTIKRRTACREAILRNFFKKLNARFERVMTAERKKELDRRYLNELIEFLSPNLQLRGESSSEYQGRTTGSVEWREKRNELGVKSESCKSTSTILRPNDNELADKIFRQFLFYRLEYNCAKDEYKRGENVIGGWENLISKHKDVFRKEEVDWKMCYLCRREGKSNGELCWSFDLDGLSIKTFSVQLNGITKYEDGNILVLVCCGDTCNMLPESGHLTIESPKDGRIDVKVLFSGGIGQLAWQHAQLFRSELKSCEADFIGDDKARNHEHEYLNLKVFQEENSQERGMIGHTVDHAKHKDCSLSDSLLNAFPDCKSKLEWMQSGWKTHSCYAQNGVNGSLCSFVIYLSEVEHHCPVLEWRKRIFKPHERQYIPAKIQRNVSALMDLMFDNDVNYQFIKGRISRLWPRWLSAYDDNLLRWPKTLINRRKLNIVIHMGFLSKESGFKFGEKATAGGPLGELVQWSDLISALYILGHNLFISTEYDAFKHNMATFSNVTPCDVSSNRSLGVVFTDIVGVRYMRRHMKQFFLEKKCLLRVLDSFGTHAEFNSPLYFSTHKHELGGRTNPWGGNGLELQQFMTMYPHTDDNTFLGFVVETHSVNESSVRTNDTLVYGKEIYMWNGSEKLLDKVNELSQLHATVADMNEFATQRVFNHGLLNGFEWHSLLRRVKIFLGLGFPLEGPAPLEAIANGAIFINPIFKPSKSRKSYAFFAEKPTLRELTSQNPYVERFIGRPHVITVDITNMSAVEKAVREALSYESIPYLPFEFTASGMLQRVNILINKQNFCGKSAFPPNQALKVVYANRSQSCEKACSTNGLICERSFFDLLNQDSVVNRTNDCEEIKKIASPLAPYKCHIQAERMLFSCASVPHDSWTERICPCRDFIRGQNALCSLCLF
ncbi:unnamed protein product [Anisakis simplex]|uniref:Peptide-N(4)-(N-acetyl-beta-glucosaminyl)asparagine amidase n=1 Tax=Anisakis simplex TaxID=6269 RepID=A0A3P6QVN6_ANISI|nr:unnamed protein product [Anisakis simplex]